MNIFPYSALAAAVPTVWNKQPANVFAAVYRISVEDSTPYLFLFTVVYRNQIKIKCFFNTAIVRPQLYNKRQVKTTVKITIAKQHWN